MPGPVLSWGTGADAIVESHHCHGEACHRLASMEAGAGFLGVSCDMVQWWVQVDAYLALLVLGHHNAYHKQELASVGALW